MLLALGVRATLDLTLRVSVVLASSSRSSSCRLPSRSPSCAGFLEPPRCCSVPAPGLGAAPGVVGVGAGAGVVLVDGGSAGLTAPGAHWLGSDDHAGDVERHAGDDVDGHGEQAAVACADADDLGVCGRRIRECSEGCNQQESRAEQESRAAASSFADPVSSPGAPHGELLEREERIRRIPGSAPPLQALHRSTTVGRGPAGAAALARACACGNPWNGRAPGAIRPPSPRSNASGRE